MWGSHTLKGNENGGPQGGCQAQGTRFFPNGLRSCPAAIPDFGGHDILSIPHPSPLPEGEGTGSLLPLGEGLGMRVSAKTELVSRRLLSAAGISWLGPARRTHGAGPKREIVAVLDLCGIFRFEPGTLGLSEPIFRAEKSGEELVKPRSLMASCEDVWSRKGKDTGEPRCRM